MPPATRKLVVYIDQHLISNIVKVKRDGLVQPDLLRLFDVLNGGLHAEKLVCPTSWFHKEEGSLTRLGPTIRHYLGYIGQLDFLPPWEIEARQFYNAALEFLGQPRHYTGWDEYLEEDPDRRLQRFTIDANLDMSALNLRQQRLDFASDMNGARAVTRHRTFKEQLELERREVPRYLHGTYVHNVLHLFRDRPDGANEYREFLASDLTRTMVSMDMFTRLCSSLLTHHNHRTVKPSDLTDMKMLSTLLPYCHVITTDKFMKELASGLDLDERFGVKLFSGKASEIAALVAHIEDRLANTAAANVPILSLLVVPDEGIKERMWEFFKRIASLARQWEGRHGEWIELAPIRK